VSMRNIAAVAAVGGLCLSGPCLGDAELLDPGNTEPLKPHLTVTGPDYIVPTSLAREFGVWRPEPLWQSGGSSNAERRAAYLRQVPYPQVSFERTDKNGPLSGYGPGVEQVFAYRYEWAADSPERTKRVVWRWEPPEDIKKRYPAWAGRSGKDRYWFLCLYPPPSEGRWKADPVVLCFDSTSGMKWRTALPVVSDPGLHHRVADQDRHPFFSPSPNVRGHIGSTPDGERVVALLYPYQNRDLAWVFVLNAEGAAIRTLVLPDREGVAAPTDYGDVLRTGGKGAFILSFRYPVPVDAEKPEGGLRSVYESYLVDRDGNFLRKFVDEEGRPVKISTSGERYALAGRPGKNGGWEHLIYELP